MRQWLFLVLAFLFLLTCAKRDGDVKERTNPVDVNGISDTVNIPPSVKVHFATTAGKATWETFNLQDSTGSVLLSFSGFDSNGVNDTLRYTFFFGPSPTALSKVDTSSLDSFYNAPHLIASTRYYYRCVVRDSRLDSAMDTGSFLTSNLFPPPAPTGLKAADDYNAIPITWNKTSGAAGFYVYRSDSANGWYEKIALTGTDTFYHDTSSSYSQHYYRVASFSSAGENRSQEYVPGRRIYSSTQIFTVQATKGDSSAGSGSIVVNLIFNAGQSGEYSCHLYRSSSLSGNYIDVKSFTANTNSIPSGTFIDRVPSTMTYYYKVATFDNQGRGSSLSSCDSGWIPRLALTTLTASNETYGPCVVLYWDAVTSATGYYIYRATSGHTSLDSTYRIIDSTRNTSYNDSVPSDKQTYDYIIVAYNTKGAGQPSTMQYGKRMQPASGLTIDTNYTSTSGIYLTWTSPYSYSSWSYIVYRSTDKKTFVSLDTVSYLYFTDTVVHDYSLYYYTIAIYYASNMSESAKSPLDSGRLKPLAPDSLWAAQPSPNTISLRWTRAKGAHGYHVYRANTQYSYTARVINTTLDTLYSDFVSNDSLYEYTITAFNESGEGEPSNGVYQKRLSPPGAPNSFMVTGGPAGIKLQWTPDHYTSYGSAVKGYYIYRTTDSTKYPFAIIDTISDSLFVDTVKDAKIYFYKVAGYNDAGVGKFGNPYGAISGQRTKPLEPDSLKASQGDTANTIRVSWRRGVGVDSFQVYRFTSCSPQDSFKLRTTTTDTEYYDPVTDDSIYSYRVVATNIIGSSSLLLSQNCAQGFRKPATDPLAPTLSGISSSETFNIYWYPPDSGARITGYNLYRAVNDSVNGFSQLATVNGTSYSDANAPLTYPPNIYYYMVRSYNSFGESVNSNIQAAKH